MSSLVIDFHAHAFSATLAARAISQLEHGGEGKAFLDRRRVSLIACTDGSGIGTSVS
jgi:hypothetical protein